MEGSIRISVLNIENNYNSLDTIFNKIISTLGNKDARSHILNVLRLYRRYTIDTLIELEEKINMIFPYNIEIIESNDTQKWDITPINAGPVYILLGAEDSNKKTAIGAIYRGDYVLYGDRILLYAGRYVYLFEIKKYRNLWTALNYLLKKMDLPTFRKRRFFGYPWREFDLTRGAGYYIAQTKNVIKFSKSPILWSLFNIHRYLRLYEDNLSYDNISSLINKLFYFFKDAFILSELYRISYALLYAVTRGRGYKGCYKNIKLVRDHLGYGYVIDIKFPKKCLNDSSLYTVYSSINFDFKFNNLIKKVKNRSVLI